MSPHHPTAQTAPTSGLGRPSGPQNWVPGSDFHWAPPPPVDNFPDGPQPGKRGSGGRALTGTAVVVGATVLGALAAVGTTLAIAPDDDPRISAVRQQRDLAGSPASASTDAEDAAQQTLLSLVQVRTAQGSGSGFVIGDANHVLTNHHVIDGSSTVTLVLPDGRRVSGTVLGSDERSDIAVIEVAGLGLPVTRIGSSAGLRIGEQVIAVGSPLGLNGTVTSGIVSALERTSPRSSQPLIQTDASINPGNSGGPLVDLDGQVVGVNTSIATLGYGSGNIGIGFAVPIDDAARIAERIISDN